MCLQFITALSFATAWVSGWRVTFLRFCSPRLTTDTHSAHAETAVGTAETAPDKLPASVSLPGRQSHAHRAPAEA